MAAPKGNQFWKARAKHGRDKIFKTPSDLWGAACEYFEWCEENPLKEEKAFAFQGEITKESVSLLRPMTIGGLCLFLGVNMQYLNDFEESLDLESREGKDFSLIIEAIKTSIKEQKFAGAAAGLFNANIIARDLGLSDKSELDHKSSDGSMTPPKKHVYEIIDPKDGE